jgi:ADP-ribosylglycohydrolase
MPGLFDNPLPDFMPGPGRTMRAQTQKVQRMYGALAGDICGSIYEWHNRKTETPEEIDLFDSRCHFTDDSVLTVGVADALLSGGDYRAGILHWARKYPQSGYGGSFRKWFNAENPRPYNSWGNGSAMRASPAGWAFGTLEETLDEAKKSAEVTHNHPEGIKGAQATAAAVFLARNGTSKAEIKEYIEKEFAYNLDVDLNELRKTYTFDESSQGTVPPAIMAFLASNDFIDAKIPGGMKQVIKRFRAKYLQGFGLEYYIK